MSRPILERAALAAALALVAAPQAMAHARLKPNANSVKPRSESSGLKGAGGCGGATIVEANRTSLSKGTQILIKWEETIHHNGSFIIDFSTNGTEAGFAANKLYELAHPAQDANPPNINDAATYVQFMTMVTLPDVTCDNCIIRMRQIMTGSGTVYFSCADVKLIDGPVPADDGGGDDGGAMDGAAADGAGEDSGAGGDDGATTAGDDASPTDPSANNKPAKPTGVTIKINKGAKK